MTPCSRPGRKRPFRGILPETALELASSIRQTDGLLGELQFWEQAAARLVAYARRRQE